MTAHNAAVYDAYRAPTRKVSAEHFVEMTARSRDEIKRVRFVPPKIGSRGFGHFEVETGTPHFEVTIE
ncbi:hypothetical protein G7008_03520 [Pseudomonas psychrotolerans]|uniref:hypothetical protein n=1 Tax=Pseudomonas oryzihabitans TaxID=47885 RepID=UPI0015E2AF02|nr:hypothetical protein [Pseudomonas psychrotolerans]MBA1179564.1 hypothetical protein [Pseudomonas psychrotolerans]MBA1212167.1 hypothetical protein [Pseudomonas psychrotolerans]